MTYPYRPYVYKITLTRDWEERYYIGCRVHQRRTRYLDGVYYRYANPELFLKGLYNGRGRVDEYINDGWTICNREVIDVFPGDDEGALTCGRVERDLLIRVNAKDNELYVNGYR